MKSLTTTRIIRRSNPAAFTSIRPLLKFGALAAVVLCVGSQSTRAETVGNPLVAGGLDGTSGGLYTADELEFSAPGTVGNWSAFGTSGRLITPLILHKPAATWTVTGIGATRTFSGGVESFSFDLVVGSAAVDADYYFGWVDGDTAGTTNTGSVPFGGGSGYFRLLGGNGPNDTFTVGHTPAQTFESSRTYSIQASTAVAATTPEPSTFALALLGLVGLATTRRRRRRA